MLTMTSQGEKILLPLLLVLPFLPSSDTNHISFGQETHRILDHKTLSIKFHRIGPMPWHIAGHDAAYSAVPDPKALSLLVTAS